MPKIELAWYASFLKNMHGIIFIAIMLGNVLDWYIRYFLERNGLDEFDGYSSGIGDGGYSNPKVEFREGGGAETEENVRR